VRRSPYAGAGRLVPGALATAVLVAVASVASSAGLARSGEGSVHSAADENAPEQRNRAAEIIARGRLIATPEGIEVLEEVDVGDDRQWISIRGRNRDNPVLLVIHGGPGTPSMPLSWAYQGPWEDYFTVVNWDQRGVGKNAASADPDKLLSTVSLDQIVLDGRAVIDHLRATLDKDKIALMGFSWGSLVGIRLVERYPDLVSVYVGVGQVVSADFETLILEKTLAAAKSAGDLPAVTELERLRTAPAPDQEFSLEQAVALRRIARRYDGMWYGHGSLDVMNELASLSPEYSLADTRAFEAGAAWLARTRIPHDIMANDLRTVRELQVPVVLLHGRYDLATPFLAAEQWWENLTAPSTRFVAFERSAHFVMLEEPGRFLVALVNHVLPLTEGAPAYPAHPRAGPRQ
jgi:proline iminopeptidase